MNGSTGMSTGVYISTIHMAISSVQYIHTDIYAEMYSVLFL